jgi:putative transposase
VVSVPARRSQVVYATGRGLSQWRACTLMGLSRSALAYQSVRVTKDGPVLARMVELSAQYPRYGYRRIAIFLARNGYPMSFSRAHRLWRQARLQVPQRRPRDAERAKAVLTLAQILMQAAGLIVEEVGDEQR